MNIPNVAKLKSQFLIIFRTELYIFFLQNCIQPEDDFNIAEICR